MSRELLPLGSVVYLEGGTEKIMVVGRGIIFNDSETNEEVFTDYMGCIFPTGINPNNTLFFNVENIDRVVFKGLSDEDEKRFLEVYSEWETKLTVRKKEIK
ncbi:MULTISPECIES: DUF4176 domain-containing protein [Streptococcus]|uniref:Uncharacterized protein conserved in bacteria n=2 Tax=Streptococcus suis TaxID=1307 RepID=A0A0Z8I6T1_STRSU|nr:DUF4176 domain-containing protein [Streptococcus suis]MBM0195843.1 DUF4176 domain-containing protein [Streptococcus suis]MBM7311980.1 DUF4176 domain-containing protein [Streptococcus suis]MBM7317363.1 DUF4176 domain-containing protein [Streptococcus suis]MBM7318578.1 DUF4176 domain-containing protein [Streptococcus suis]MBO3642419.1 DUF4176 domain-containing protein [Streptococcus suis]